jgi:cytochrome c peroxidase
MPGTAEHVAASRGRSGMGLGIGLACLLGFPFGCTDEYSPLLAEGEAYGGFTKSQWEKIQQLSRLPAPPEDPTNAFADDAAAARLGQRLFFDEGYGGRFEDEPTSCATCHEPHKGFITDHPDAKFRNTTTVVNAVYYDWYTWDGHRDSLWSLPLGPVENEDMINTTRLQVAHRLAEAYADDYAEAFGEVFGDQLQQFSNGDFPPSGKPDEDDPDPAWEALSDSDKELVNRIFANFGKALAAYMRLVVTKERPSDFDRFVAGDPDAIEDDAKRGLRLFVGHANCIKCHDGPAMTDNQFHNIAIETNTEERGRRRGIERLRDGEFNEDSPYSDGSRNRLAELDPDVVDEYAFRTPTLRNVAKKERWMHTREFGSLEEVIRHYSDPPDRLGERSEDIQGLTLSDDEIADLVALLKTFSSEPDPSLKMDTAARR